MDTHIALTIFFTVFVAELGDKTQLATMLFAADQKTSAFMVFAVASAALIASSALAVIAGQTLSNFLDPRWLSLIAGVGFIGIGLWTVFSAW
ncbi:MAG: TMEM165/GDT1 family protein [Pseudomonadaceae bacterium]|nr:TMEM165/GDT1 family protein [Pseudomonadaceae bacterium]